MQHRFSTNLVCLGGRELATNRLLPNGSLEVALQE